MTLTLVVQLAMMNKLTMYSQAGMLKNEHNCYCCGCVLCYNA